MPPDGGRPKRGMTRMAELHELIGRWMIRVRWSRDRNRSWLGVLGVAGYRACPVNVVARADKTVI